MNEMIFQREGSVTCDFEGIKNRIEAQTKQYDGIVFTEDTKTEAKKTVANIRKDKKDFLDRVKEAKDIYMRPWNTFYDKACEIASLFDKPVNYINEQIDAFEESRKKEKDSKIKEIFGEMVFEQEILEFLPLSKVYNEKWLNATYTEKQIKDAIMTEKLNVKASLQTIKSFNSDVQDKALQVFKETLNLSEALKVITDYEESKKIARESIKAEVKAEAQEQAREDVIAQFIPTEGGEELAYNYTIFLTEDAKQKLETFMDSIGIEYFRR